MEENRVQNFVSNYPVFAFLHGNSETKSLDERSAELVDTLSKHRVKFQAYDVNRDSKMKDSVVNMAGGDNFPKLFIQGDRPRFAVSFRFFILLFV